MVSHVRAIPNATTERHSPQRRYPLLSIESNRLRTSCHAGVRLLAVVLAVLVTPCFGQLPASGEPPPRVRSSGDLPDGTRRMGELLAARSSAAKPEENIFLNDRRVAFFQQQAGQLPLGARRTQTQMQIGLEMVLAGRPEQGIAQFEAVEAELKAAGVQVNPAFQAQLYEMLALAHLRRAEQLNCLEHHSTDSCLMPLRGGGIHGLPESSAAAQRYLEKVLEMQPANLGARWLLNLVFMTLGTYPDAVPEAWRIPEEAFASPVPFPRFTDVASGAGLATVGLAGGVCLDDFSGDGRPDVLVSSWGIDDPLHFLVNQGDGTFLDRSEPAGLTGLTGGLNLIHADYDNDGDLDVFVLRGAWLSRSGGWPNSLLRNNGDGTFEDVTEAAGVLSFHPTQTGAFADFDGDGWLDLFVGNESGPVEEHPCELFINQRDGTFLDRAEEHGVSLRAFVKGVAARDYDLDGRVDLYLSCLGEPNRLLHNEGVRDETGAWRGAFRDVAEAAGVQAPLHSFPTWFFDHDNDGWPDLFVSGYRWFGSVENVAADYLGLPNEGSKPRLYHNQGDGTFADVTAAAGLDHVLMTMGSSFGDLDFDGFLDFYVGTGEPDLKAIYPNRMFLNVAGERFVDVTTAGGFGHIQKGHGVAFADIDDDGDQDVFAVMGGAFSGDVYQNVLFENPGPAGHFLYLTLQGREANRCAIGARVIVAAGERRLHRTVGTGGSFGSTTLRQEIGLGAATEVDWVEVYWPGSGRVQRFLELTADRGWLLREGDEKAEPRSLVPVPLARAKTHH